MGDGGAGIGPVTYTPFPDPPVSSPGEILLFINCVQTTILGIEREKAFKIYVDKHKRKQTNQGVE